MKIDKEKSFTPFRIINNELKYTDHYSILLEMELPKKEKENKITTRKQKLWNLNKVDGWKNYKTYTYDNKVLRSVKKEFINNVTDEYKKIEKEMDKCKYKAFGKVLYRPERNELKETSKLMKKKETILGLKNVNNKKIQQEVLKINEDISRSIKEFLRRNLKSSKRTFQKREEVKVFSN